MRTRIVHTTDDCGAKVLEADPVNYDCLSNLAKIAYSRGELQQVCVMQGAGGVRGNKKKGQGLKNVCSLHTRAHDLAKVG